MAQTLGDLTVRELLKSATSEALAVGDGTERDTGTLRAYSGSIAARVQVALMKLERGEGLD